MCFPRLRLPRTRALAASLLTVVVLLFFLLIPGNSFLRRIVEILPTLTDKKQAVDITYEIQRTVSVYLGTVTLMNAGMGSLTGVAASLCGLSDPVPWGSQGGVAGGDRPFPRHGSPRNASRPAVMTWDVKSDVKFRA